MHSQIISSSLLPIRIAGCRLESGHLILWPGWERLGRGGDLLVSGLGLGGRLVCAAVE
jgi:hypothetical protein